MSEATLSIVGGAYPLAPDAVNIDLFTACDNDHLVASCVEPGNVPRAISGLIARHWDRLGFDTPAPFAAHISGSCLCCDAILRRYVWPYWRAQT